MATIIGVRFERPGRVHYFTPPAFTVKINDLVVVSSGAGERIGKVVITPDQIVINQLREPLPGISRLATPNDLELIDKDRAPI